MAITWTTTGTPTKVYGGPSNGTLDSWVFPKGYANYVDLSTNYDWNLSGKDWTVIFWVYNQESDASDKPIIGNWNLDDAKRSYFIANQSGGQLYFVTNSTGSASSTLMSGTAGNLPLNTWTHCAIKYRSSDYYTQMYINGSLNSSKTMSFIADFNYTTFGSLATNSTADANSFTGRISSLYLYHEVLTDIEIQKIYNDELPLINQITGEIAHYDMSIERYIKYLNGSSDYVSVSNSSDFELGTSDFAIEFKIKWHDYQSYWRGIIGQGYEESASIKQYNWFIVKVSGQDKLRFWVNNGANLYDTDALSLANGTEYTIKLTKVGNTLSWFVDAVAKGTHDVTGLTIASGNFPLSIGRGRFGAGSGSVYYLGATLSEMSIDISDAETWHSDEIFTDYEISDIVGGNHGVNSGATQVTGRKGFNGLDMGNAMNFVSGNSVEADVTIPTGDFSLSVWLKRSGSGPNAEEIFFGRGTGQSVTWEIYYQSSLKYLAIWYDASHNIQTVDVSSIITDGQWHHIAFTITSSKRAVYVDGISKSLAGDTWSHTHNFNNGSTSVQIGNWSYDNRSFVGAIDDFRLFDRALTREEVSTLYKNKTQAELPEYVSAPEPTTYSLTYRGIETQAIAYTDNISRIQIELESNPYIGSGNIQVISTENGNEIEFINELGFQENFEILQQAVQPLGGTISISQDEIGGAKEYFTVNGQNTGPKLIQVFVDGETAPLSAGIKTKIVENSTKVKIFKSTEGELNGTIEVNVWN
jgi:hypothetical protein